MKFCISLLLIIDVAADFKTGQLEGKLTQIKKFNLTSTRILVKLNMVSIKHFRVKN